MPLNLNMSKLSKLLRVTEEEKEAILKHFNKTEESFNSDAELLKEWLKKNTHLPDDNDISRLRMCLLNSKMSIERAKKNLEGYYTIRSMYEDFYQKLIPTSEYFEKGKRYVFSVPMPKLTPELNRITIFKMADVNGEAEDGLSYYVSTMMIAELRVIGDCFISNVLVIDLALHGLKSMLKFTPSLSQKLQNIQNSLNLRFHSVHLINVPSFFERFLPMVRAMVPAKIMSRVHFHSNLEDLYKHIGKEYLPSDYGGTEKSLEELYDDWCQEILYFEPLYNHLLSLKAKGEFKVERCDEEIFGMGSDGSFKKLAID